MFVLKHVYKKGTWKKNTQLHLTLVKTTNHKKEKYWVTKNK